MRVTGEGLDVFVREVISISLTGAGGWGGGGGGGEGSEYSRLVMKTSEH